MRPTRTSRWRAPLLTVLGGTLAAAWGTAGGGKAPAAAAMAIPEQAWEQTVPERQGVYSAGLSAALEYSSRAERVRRNRHGVHCSRIADPIGMTRWRWTKNDSPTGRVLSWQGGIWTSSRELARFGHLFLNRGNWNGRQLLDASWVDQATTVQVPATIPNDTPPRSRGAGVYGYNWWVNGIKPDGRRLWPGAPHRTYYANGLHNNVCIVVPEWNLVLARTNSGRKDGSANTPPNVDDIWSGFFGKLAEAVRP